MLVREPIPLNRILELSLKVIFAIFDGLLLWKIEMGVSDGLRPSCAFF
jgi:hypothetical protein